MKHRRFLILLVLLVVGIGGNVAWNAYEDHQREEAWESLLEGSDCTACSAPKASMTEKANKRKAEKSLLQALESEPPVNLSGHTENSTVE